MTITVPYFKGKIPDAVVHREGSPSYDAYDFEFDEDIDSLLKMLDPYFLGDGYRKHITDQSLCTYHPIDQSKTSVIAVRVMSGLKAVDGKDEFVPAQGCVVDIIERKR
ncbi:MAG: hypothetical protein JST12_15325 [Armatimonadetes bacterium]|nr:hypothetical protein [Armatimonadota bacterium]